MKRLLLILLLFCGALQAKELGLDITTQTFAGTTITGSVPANAKQVTFIFNSAFVGTVATVTFVGSNDQTLTLKATTGDTLDTIAYTVTAGSVRIVRLQ